MKKVILALAVAVVCGNIRAAVHPAATYDELKTLVEGSDLQDGDTVELTGERYVFAAPLTFPKSVTLRGASATARAVLDGDGRVCGLRWGAVNTPTLENLVFTNFYSASSADFGAAVAYDRGSCLTVRNCAFLGNRSAALGAAVYAQRLVLDGCQFTANVVFADTKPQEGRGGGAIYIRNETGSFAAFTNCTFVANRLEQTVANGGGGAINSTAAPVRLAGCTFSNNYSVAHGGCVFGNLAYATNCTFAANTAVQTGGVLSNCNNTYSPALIEDCRFIDNAANDYGGAIRNHSRNKGQLSFANCTFRGNRSPVGGGAIYCDGHYLGTCRGCTFDSNDADDGDSQATPSGGAIHGGAVWMEDCLFTNNHAKTLGGAVYGHAFSTAAEGGGVVTNCRFYANRIGGSFAAKNGSTLGGAGIYVDSGYAKVADCRFVGNCCEKIVWSKGSWTVNGSAAGLVSTSGGEIRDCTFVANLATNVVGSRSVESGCGTLYLGTAENRADRCTFTANTNALYSSWGSAICVRASTYTGTNYISNCACVSNVCLGTGSAGAGGTLEFRMGRLVMTDTVFADNTTIRDGGAFGIYPHGIKRNDAAVWFFVDRCSFLRNVSSNNGGACYFNGAGDWAKPASPDWWTNRTDFVTGTIRNSLFVGNRAAGNGGALATGTARDIVLENCTFLDNSCGNKKQGGAVYLSGSYRRYGEDGKDATVNVCSGGITNCLFYGNTVNGSQDNVNAHIFCNSAGEMCSHDFEQVGPKNFLTDGLFGNLVRDDPGLVDAAAGDGSLKRKSICVNAGTNHAWMVGATYLNPANPRRSGRIAEKIVDIGCYEFWLVPGLLLLVH